MKHIVVMSYLGIYRFDYTNNTLNTLQEVTQGDWVSNNVSDEIAWTHTFTENKVLNWKWHGHMFFVLYASVNWISIGLGCGLTPFQR